MSIALDIGASRLRSLRREGPNLIGRGVPAAFALLPDEPSARDLLTRAGVTFAEGDGELALVGDGAAAHAAALYTTPLRLLPGGLVPDGDPPARQLLGTLVESLLPEAPEPGEPCGLVMPAAATTDESSREFLSRLVRLRGYEPTSVSASHAVALATLSAEGFTGVAVSFGAGGRSLSLVHGGRELAVVSEPRGTDWIDARLAAADRRYAHDSGGDRYLDTDAIRRQREAISDPLTRPMSDFAIRVADLYRELLLSTAREFSRVITDGGFGPFATPLPVVCAGGGTRPPGFAGLMNASLAAADLPLAIGLVRLAPADDYLVARGALIHAELDATCSAAA